MSRLKPKQIEELSPEHQKTLKQAQEMMGFMANDGLIMAHIPGVMDVFAALVSEVYSLQATTASFKRLIGYMTSAAAGCTYCVAHTASAAEKLGISLEKLNAIWEYENSHLFTERERVALRIAHHAGLSPNAVDDDQYEQFAQYYNEAEQAEVIAVIALFGFLNRWNSTLATEIETLPMASYRKLK